jgi:hypothetical protein
MSSGFVERVTGGEIKKKERWHNSEIPTVTSSHLCIEQMQSHANK